MSFTIQERQAILKELSIMANSDGNVSQKEASRVIRTGEKFHLNIDEIEEAIAMDNTKAREIILGMEYNEKLKLLVELVKVMMADGHVNTEEKKTLKKMSLAFKINERDLKGLL